MTLIPMAMLLSSGLKKGLWRGAMDFCSGGFTPKKKKKPGIFWQYAEKSSATI
jgi:hypothetical protein